MPGKIKPVGSLFAGVQDKQEVSGLKTQISELQEEIERLRIANNSPAKGELTLEEKATLEQKIQELTEQLAESGGVHKIPIELIDPDLEQPRTIFPQHVIAARAESLRNDGQLTPVIVIPLENGRYRLFEGNLRWLAAPHASLTHLDAVFRQEEDKASTFDRQLTTSIQSEKLHGLDLATGLIKLITFKDANLGEDEIPSILNRAVHKLKQTGDDKALEKVQSLSHEEQQIWLQSMKLDDDQRFVLQIILGKNLNPASIQANIFPLLKLPKDVQVAMRNGLEASKAREIGKLTSSKTGMSESAATTLRENLAHKAIAEQWSLTELRQKIKDASQPRSENKPQPVRQIIEKVQNLLQGVKLDPKQDKSDLEELEKQLEAKLNEVRHLLHS